MMMMIIIIIIIIICSNFHPSTTLFLLTLYCILSYNLTYIQYRKKVTSYICLFILSSCTCSPHRGGRVMQESKGGFFGVFFKCFRII